MVIDHIFKIYRNGAFIKALDNVISPFRYSQAINEPGVELIIELGNDLEDTGGELTQDFLVDENDDNIIDENSDFILIASDTQFTDIPIELGNRIKVTEVSDYNPEGTVVFNGIISKWKYNTDGNNIILTCLSDGVQLDNYIFSELNNNGAINSETYNATLTATGGTVDIDTDSIAQTFTPGSNLTVNSVSIVISGSSYMTGGNPPDTFYTYADIAVVVGTPDTPGSTLGSVRAQIATTTQLQTFAFPAPISLLSGTSYFIQATPRYARWGASITVSYDNTNPYAGGVLYSSIDGGTTWSAVGGDMAFRINADPGQLTPAFLSTPPSTILRTALDLFKSQGGRVSYDEDSIDDVSAQASYQFILATYLEVAEVVRKLSPGSYYWYIDLSTNIFHFHPKHIVEDHTFIVGKHVESLEIEKSLENVKNIVYFSGGDDGSGTNLLKLTTSDSSIAQYGQWLERISDNRVTREDSATLISDNAIQEPSYNTVLKIPASAYDLTTIYPGEVVRIANTNILISSLLLQIIRIDRSADMAVLYLDTFIPLINQRVETLKKALDKLETVNNPDSV